MRLNKISPNELNLNLILCALFTLMPNSSLFKNLNINDKLIVQLNKDEFVFINSKNIVEFSTQLNKPSLRQIAYKAIQPLFPKKSFLLTPTNRRNDKNQHLLLKRYLRKFNYSYKRYFLFKTNLYLTDKEINYFALESLFLIAGV